ncbi:uncharacterized protein C8A04DRAFT_28090 [Dichotomopilus funicola]|uniref:C2H2-type domain-containing protein n=1 Tax=Dichotomopilus funicola TaxID=1934379 RepID=A0AAN6ZN99_9PEZI|nr:hypothetical protein C8A04DRAFT_28090 [Dichotomopilus funicola]
MVNHSQFPQQGRYMHPNLGNVSPTSPTAFTPHSHGQPGDLAMSSVFTFPPMAASSNNELMGELQSLVGSHSQQDVLHSTYPRMKDRGGPWNPLSVARQSVGLSYPQAIPNFTGYRSVAPSEIDTISQSAKNPTDSGYGSHTKLSIGNASILSGDMDSTFETQNITFRMQAMLGRDDVSMSGESWGRDSRSQRPGVPGSRTTKKLVCPVCHDSVKTRSELTKHEARHNKPFKCPVQGCAKADGFGTKNDLDRHKKSVHKMVTGDEHVYRCNLGACSDRGKDWPRADNFRQHLKRKHQLTDVDLKQFTFLSTPVQQASHDAISMETTSAGASLMASPTSQMVWQKPDDTTIASDHSFSNENSGPAETTDELSYRQPISMGIYLSQNQTQNPSLATAHELSLAHVGVSGSSTQTGEASIERPSQEQRQLECISPNVLTQPAAGIGLLDQFETSEQPMDLDVSPTPSVPPGEFQSEVDELESRMQEELGGASELAHTSVSEDGLCRDHDDEDDDEPLDDLSDARSTILRNTGAQYIKADVVSARSSPSHILLGTETPRPIDLDDETQMAAVIRRLIEKGELETMLKKCGYPTSIEAKADKPQTPTTVSTATSKPTRTKNKCEVCGKFFHRPCELKKHRKRHAKPYSCTFPRCEKSFGSKNDWKRHENSQHIQDEIWRCTEEPIDRPGQQECGKVCYRRESLKSHLTKDHGIHDLVTLDKKLAECRMGRNFESRFWCGFCQKTIEPTGRGGPVHSERFDHIENHYNGRDGLEKVDIKDWKYIENDQGESPTTSTHASAHVSARASANPSVAATPNVSATTPLPASRTQGKQTDKLNKRNNEGSGEEGAPKPKRLKDGKEKYRFWICVSSLVLNAIITTHQPLRVCLS